MKNIKSYEVLSMREFLENFVNLDNLLTDEVINKLESNKVTHLDLTEIGIPYIKRIPYEMVEEEDLLTGRVILVNDFKGNSRHPRIAPYIRPEFVKKEELVKRLSKSERSKNYGSETTVFAKE